jgi:hypothetical protein
MRLKRRCGGEEDPRDCWDSSRRCVTPCKHPIHWTAGSPAYSRLFARVRTQFCLQLTWRTWGHPFCLKLTIRTLRDTRFAYSWLFAHVRTPVLPIGEFSHLWGHHFANNRVFPRVRTPFCQQQSIPACEDTVLPTAEYSHVWGHHFANSRVFPRVRTPFCLQLNIPTCEDTILPTAEYSRVWEHRFAYSWIFTHVGDTRFACSWIFTHVRTPVLPTADYSHTWGHPFCLQLNIHTREDTRFAYSWIFTRGGHPFCLQLNIYTLDTRTSDPRSLLLAMNVNLKFD